MQWQYTPRATKSFVGAAKEYASDFVLPEGRCTHNARFNRHIEVCLSKYRPWMTPEGFFNGQKLSMSRALFDIVRSVRIKHDIKTLLRAWQVTSRMRKKLCPVITHIHWPIGVVHSSADNFTLVYKDATHWSLSLRQRLLPLNFNVSWVTPMVWLTYHHKCLFHKIPVLFFIVHECIRVLLGALTRSHTFYIILWVVPMSRGDLWREQYATAIHYPPRKCICSRESCTELYCRTLILTVDRYDC